MNRLQDENALEKAKNRDLQAQSDAMNAKYEEIEDRYVTEILQLKSTKKALNDQINQ